MNESFLIGNGYIRKSVLKEVILAALFITTLCVFPPSCFSQPRLILGTFTGPPLSNPDQRGMVDRVLREAFNRTNVDIEIVHLPAERSLSNADAGIIDGDFIRISGLERLYPDLLRVPEKIVDFEFVAFTRHADFRTESWESLKPYHVGIEIGWKILEENIVGAATRTDVRNKEILFSLLANDRADLVVYSRFVGWETVRELGLKGIRVLEPPLAVREMYLYLNKKHLHLVPLISEAIQDMKRDGTFEKIRNDTLTPYVRSSRHEE